MCLSGRSTRGRTSGRLDAFQPNLGTAVLYGKTQLAVFKLKDGSVFATQNMCPHKQAFVLAQGIASDGEVPKVACPLHKKQFDLSSGKEINGGDLEIVTFEAKVEGGRMMLHLPPRRRGRTRPRDDASRGCARRRPSRAGLLALNAHVVPVYPPSSRGHTPGSLT